MKTFIRRTILVAMAMSAAASVWSAPAGGNAERDEKAVQVAKAWFVSLMRGETDVTTSLSAVPFLFDGKREIQAQAELKKVYDGIVAKKGKRDLKPSSADVKTSSPDSVVVLLQIEGDDEKIAVTVKPGEAFLVVGFAD